MEATSARMASRYQFEGFPAPRSPLQRYIYNACDPLSNIDPNLALNLEIVDLINQKKGSAPREAAFTIVQLINHRNPNVSLLALSLLDNCVKNCGYPFHLQISTKEFLNELVRKFPERPPVRTSRVQTRILEAIEEWRATICQTSKYKDDLGYIRDMHRLLLYKGYMFPEVRRDDAAVLNPSDNLKSAEEMEEEERAAQSAKLQELIRRGTPQDLQEANKLMKVMAGYDTRNKTDYRAKAAEEVSKVQQKARILEEMLQSVKEGESIQEGDVFEELANALQSAQPKIQKMCEEESDDAEAVAKLLEINDSIHRTVERYKLIKAGNVTAANSIPKGTLGTTTGVGRNAKNQLSLIDFDPEPEAPSHGSSGTNGSLLGDTSIGVPKSNRSLLEDDLLGLSLDGPSASGSIALAGPMSQNSFSVGPPPSLPANIAPPTSTKPNYMSPPPQSPAPASSFDAFASLVSQSSRPASTPPGKSLASQSARPASTDPFAALVSSSRPQTPSQQRTGLLGTSSPAPKPSPGQSKIGHSVVSSENANDDEWTFQSAPEPETTYPSTAEIMAHQSANLQIAMKTTRQQTGTSPAPIAVRATFSNLSTQPISGVHFQVAVEKQYSLQLKPATSKELSAQSRGGITQDITINGVPVDKGALVKLRFKVTYLLAGRPVEEQGMVTGLGIS